MRNFLIKVVVNGLGLWVAALVIEGIELGVEGEWTDRLVSIVLVALVFGLINAIVKPIATFFSFPLIVLTLGLFALIVNALMLLLLSWIAGETGLAFSVEQFWWDAVLGAIVITFVSMVLNLVLPERD